MRPLAGCRVLDMGIITAGAATSALLADLGAEVIKVEAPKYRDPFRQWAADAPAGEALPPFFRATNRNKSGVSIDLKHPEGHAAFAKLVANSDVVVENFRRGVLEGFGLGYEQLRTHNPEVILASISSQGETGPDSRQISFGTTLEAVGGLAWLTGYRDDAPTVSGVDLNYPDQVVAVFAAGMIATAWHARQRGRGGVHLDLSQRELTSFLAGEAFAAPDAGGRTGNDQPPHLLQDCFLCGDGRWVAVTVEAEAAERVQALVGAPLATPADLRTGLMDWMAQQRADEIVGRLAGLGVPAAVSLNGEDVFAAWRRQPSFALARSPDGTLAKGFPFQLDRDPLTITREAPLLGADTREVLMTVGGYSTDEVDRLAAAGVVELGREATA